MEYELNDFITAVDIATTLVPGDADAGIADYLPLNKTITEVLYAYGHSEQVTRAIKFDEQGNSLPPETGEQWVGGFIVKCDDNSYALLSCWKDIEGWDGNHHVCVMNAQSVEEIMASIQSDYSINPDAQSKFGLPPEIAGWDYLPQELNNWVQSEHE